MTNTAGMEHKNSNTGNPLFRNDKEPVHEIEVEELWEEIKRVTSKAKEQHLTTEGKRQAKKHKIQRKIRKKIRQAKEQYITSKCKEIVDLNSRHDTFN
ncbi:hypothetical protein ILUMI_16821, partial [Ignelater luminosus]